MAAFVLNDFLSACRDHPGGEPANSLRQISGAFLARAGEDASVLTTAAKSLPALPLPGAAWLAMVLGAAVEQGKNAELTAPAVVGLLRAWLSMLPQPVEPPEDEEEEEEEEEIELTPAQEAVLDALPELGRSVVAHLARASAYRAELSNDAALIELLESLGGYSNGIAWVHEALLRSSGTLIVLHPPTRTGLKLRYENVGFCFHLFSLLQTAIGQRLPGGRTPDPKVADVARGKLMEDVIDEAWWHFGDPGATTPDLNSSIWGEGLVRDIPSIDGQQILLLWPPILQSKCWSAGFGPHLEALPADVIVEEALSAEDSRRWLRAVGL